MKYRRIISVIMLSALVLSMLVPAIALADDSFTVNFYTDNSLTTLHTTQTVALGGHPEIPEPPESYTEGSYTYKFNTWYWTIDGRNYEFSFTDDECEIWSDTNLFAGYSQYLAEGYEMIVVHSTNSEFIEDTETPISEILSQYTGITNVIIREKEEYVQGSNIPEENINKASITFADVDESKWYAPSIAAATELGLINGFDDGNFYPDNNLTYAEAVKLAACMHQLKTTGEVTLANGGGHWYDSYVEYAKTNGIITKDYDWTAKATRSGYVEIFAHALPDEALAAVNSVADDAIPDVVMTDYAAAEIYKLYRAGVLTGSDSIGTFNPESNIRRSEVAAILTRMMDESARKTITLS